MLQVGDNFHHFVIVDLNKDIKVSLSVLRIIMLENILLFHKDVHIKA